LFKNSSKTLTSISIGVSQGSPISPLLFVIYVAPLYIHAPFSTTLSFVDDFAIMVASKSAQQNATLLQSAATEIQTIGSVMKVRFSILRTELMHWTTI